MAQLVKSGGGPRSIGTLSVDADGYRTFEATWPVELAPGEGIYAALLCPELPAIGDTWSWGTDADPWSWRRPEAKVTPCEGDGPSRFADVALTWSNKPYERKKCAEQQIEDPLLEPQKISGSSVRYTQEADRDRFGRPIVNSSWEPLRGEQVTFDRNRGQVKIQQNVPVLQAALCYGMVDHVNDRPLWGMPRRCVKLSEFTWERLFYGRCYVYYRRNFTFDVDGATFDRDLHDVGSRVLNGHWHPTTKAWVLDNVNGAPPNRFDPTHFIACKDFKEELVDKVPLNGRGLPAQVVVTDSDRYLSAPTGIFNSGNPLSNGSYWVPLTGSLTPSVWDADTHYERGRLVTVTGVAGTVYVSLEANRDKQPNFVVGLEFWRIITGAITDAGIYSAATDYPSGNYVTSGAGTAPGTIHVEKYPEANFFLLAIPITF